MLITQAQCALGVRHTKIITNKDIPMPSILQFMKFNVILAIVIGIMSVIHSLYTGNQDGFIYLAGTLWAGLYLSEIWNKVE